MVHPPLSPASRGNPSFSRDGAPPLSPQAGENPSFSRDGAPPLSPASGGNPSFSGETGVTHCVSPIKNKGIEGKRN